MEQFLGLLVTMVAVWKVTVALCDWSDRRNKHADVDALAKQHKEKHGR